VAYIVRVRNKIIMNNDRNKGAKGRRKYQYDKNEGRLGMTLLKGRMNE